MKHLVANINSETSCDIHEDRSSNSDLVEVVQFKFPKGFRLKRRKKIILVAADALNKMRKTHPNSSPQPSTFTASVQPKASARRQTSTTPVIKPKVLTHSKTSSSLSAGTNTQKTKIDSPTTSSMKDKPKFKQSSSMLSLSSSAAASNRVKSQTITQSSPSSTVVSSQSISQPSRHSPPKTSIAASLLEPASIKCSCCACTAQRVNLTRNGDTEILEVKEVPNWGKGLMVVTKFINNKNVVKFINYKCIKNMWLNTSYGKDDEINTMSS